MRKSKSWWLSSESDDDSREMEFKPANSPRGADTHNNDIGGVGNDFAN